MNKDTKYRRSHRVQLTCPHCHETQWEPTLAVSTYCHSCGQHFSIADGKALSPKKNNGIIVPIQRDEETVSAPAKTNPVRAGWRKVLRTLPSPLRKNAGHGPQKRFSKNTRSVRCVDCGFDHDVSSAASSSLCPACSAYNSLEDIHVRDDSRRKIKTQGDVFIHKNAALQAGLVVCRHLRVEGNVSGKINCSGNATFAADSKIIGGFACNELIVARNAHVTFLHPVRAASLKIAGEISGDFFCSGPVKINSHGAIHGELLAKSLSIDPRGKLNGEFHICRGEEHAREAAQEAEDRSHIDRRGITDFAGDLFGPDLSPST